MRIWLVVLTILTGLGCNEGTPVSRSVGAQCESKGDCDDICLTAPEYPDGFCSLSCDDNRDCPGGTLCVGDGQGVCLFACEQAVDCEFLGPGWTCALRSRHPSGEANVCVGS